MRCSLLSDPLRGRLLEALLEREAPDSDDNQRLHDDVDVLVEFDQNAKVGLIKLAGIELELGELIGRKVDLNTAGCISKYFRDKVLLEAEDLYVAA